MDSSLTGQEPDLEMKGQIDNENRGIRILHMLSTNAFSFEDHTEHKAY